jgi:hypothetical protein
MLLTNSFPPSDLIVSGTPKTPTVLIMALAADNAVLSGLASKLTHLENESTIVTT